MGKQQKRLKTKWKNFNGCEANEFFYDNLNEIWKVKCHNKISNEQIIYECKRVICSAAMKDAINNVSPP